MSSPNTNGYSASAAAAAAAAAAGRKRQTPSAPVYSPNETLNQMTQEVEYWSKLYLNYYYLK